MAQWFDYISLIITVSLLLAVVYGVLYMNNQVRKTVRATKNSLQSRGVEVSGNGISLKTQSKLGNRENYVDATQRGFIKAINASSGGHSANSSPNIPAQVPWGGRRGNAGGHDSRILHAHRKSDAASLH